MINAPKYFSGFNGLRAIAVLLVVLIFHGKIIFPGMYNGWIGVDLFFVISGFLITNILVKQKGTTNFFSNFYLRRSIRIFPLYYIVLLVAMLILYLIKRDQLTDLSYYFFYVQNIRAISTEKYISLLAHTWSLCIEEQFYLVWPVIVYFCPLKKKINIPDDISNYFFCFNQTLLCYTRL
ncbi:acyltransferase family protein [Pedobacter sp. NJ-S-72]